MIAFSCLPFLPRTGKNIALLAAAALLHPSLATAADQPSKFAKPVLDLGIVVQDQARTARFLTNAIGLVEVNGFSVTPQLGRDIGLIDGHAVDVRVFVMEDVAQATRIKILSFPEAKSTKQDQKFIHSTLGISYLTLFVRDMDRMLERLKKAKVPLEGKSPVDLGDGNVLVTVRDPDGNFIELIGPQG
jgi:catechol 2,3-dioxygenase-like lactoylglutathione lyase family enzyme